MTADLGFIAAAAYPSPPHYSSPQQRKASVSSLYDRAAMASLSPSQTTQRGFSAGPSGQEKLSTLNLDVHTTGARHWKQIPARLTRAQTDNHRSDGVQNQTVNQP